MIYAMTQEQIDLASHKLLNVLREMAALAKARNTEVKFNERGIVIGYPERIFNSHQTYKLETMVPMAMFAAVTDSVFNAPVNKIQDSEFIQPGVVFEPDWNLTDLFVALNKKLDAFVAENSINLRCIFTRRMSSIHDRSDEEHPLAILRSARLDGSYVNINLLRDFLFFYYVQDKIVLTLKETGEGENVQQYVGLAEEAHKEYYDAFNRILAFVQTEIVTPEFQALNFKPEPEEKKTVPEKGVPKNSDESPLLMKSEVKTWEESDDE